jgi:hypothetical protein
MNRFGASTRIVVSLVLGVLGSALALACSSDPVESVQPEIASLAASAGTRADLGVATWQTYEDDAGRWVLALDANGGQVARLHAVPTGDDQLELTVSPGDEVLTIARDGKLSGPGAPRYGALATALYADAQAKPFLTATATAQLAAANNDSLQWQEDFQRSGGLFGYRDNFDAGYGCGGWWRSYYDYYVTGGSANFYIERWLSNDPTDCRVRVHIGISAFGWANCRALVYVNR